MAYASSYYDPQKAHEYYMAHRKLKGRKKGAGRSTSQLTDEGKEALAYVKEKLKEERDAIKERTKQLMMKQIEGIQEQIKSGNLSSEQKKVLRAKIGSLRNIYKQAKTANANLYKAKLEAETDKVYNNYSKKK